MIELTPDQAALALAWLRWHLLDSFDEAAAIALAPVVAIVQDHTTVEAYWRGAGVELLPLEEATR